MRPRTNCSYSVVHTGCFAKIIKTGMSILSSFHKSGSTVASNSLTATCCGVFSMSALILVAQRAVLDRLSDRIHESAHRLHITLAAERPDESFHVVLVHERAQWAFDNPERFHFRRKFPVISAAHRCSIAVSDPNHRLHGRIPPYRYDLSCLQIPTG